MARALARQSPALRAAPGGHTQGPSACPPSELASGTGAVRGVGKEGPHTTLGTQEPSWEGALFIELAGPGVLLFLSSAPLSEVVGGRVWKSEKKGNHPFLLPTLTPLESLCVTPSGSDVLPRPWGLLTPRPPTRPGEQDHMAPLPGRDATPCLCRPSRRAGQSGQQHLWGQSPLRPSSAIPPAPAPRPCKGQAGHAVLPAYGPEGAAGTEEPLRGTPTPSVHPARASPPESPPPLGNSSPGNTSLPPCLTSHLVPRPGPLPAGLTVPPAQRQGHGLPGAPGLARGSPGPIRAKRGGPQGWRVEPRGWRDRQQGAPPLQCQPRPLTRPPHAGRRSLPH